MQKVKDLEGLNPLNELCATIKRLTASKDYEACEKLIYTAMKDFPHAPHPHNLLGIVLERSGDHVLAMKHFRAAWALDPTYRPASHNLEVYGTFFSDGGCAFDEDDIPTPRAKRFTAGYDAQADG